MKTQIRNPHNLVPDRFQPSTIAIVGGKGSMGRRLGEEFFKDGYQVRLTGEDPLQEIGPTDPKDWKRAVRRWNSNVCQGADVIVLAVPIPLLSEGKGLTGIFGHTPPRGWRNKLVIDICSTKTGPLKALSELKGATVIGTHPMFGPKLKSLAGQTVFVCPVAPSDRHRVLQRRLAVRLKWLKEFWERRGVQIVEVAPEEHDSFMPAVQFGVLLSVLLYGDGLMQSVAPLPSVKDRGTPNSRVLCARLARMISPSMLSTYVNLAFDNPNNRRWLNTAIESLGRLRTWMTTGDRDAVLGWLQKVSDFQSGSFQNHFSETSVFLDECLAKRDFLTACLASEVEIGEVVADLSANSTKPNTRAA